MPLTSTMPATRFAAGENTGSENDPGSVKLSTLTLSKAVAVPIAAPAAGSVTDTPGCATPAIGVDAERSVTGCAASAGYSSVGGAGAIVSWGTPLSSFDGAPTLPAA